MTTNKGGQPPHVFTPEQVIEVGALAAVLSQEQIADYLVLPAIRLPQYASDSLKFLSNIKKVRHGRLAQ